MADSKPLTTLGELTRAFVATTTAHQRDLEKVKDEALSHKVECAQRYDALLADLQTHLDSLQAMMAELQSILHYMQEIEQPLELPARAKGKD
jgi:hypothetical protein